MGDDAKRSKALKLIVSLQRVVDHPNTGDGERQAAQGRIKALREKYGIDEPKKADPKTRTTFDREAWERFSDHFHEGGTDAERTARRIKRQQEEYDLWKKLNDEQNRKSAAKAEERRKSARKAREEAQERWKRKMASKNADGMPLTEEEMEEARRDPLGWATKQDGRTAAQKNADAQSQYTHTYRTRKCERPETFFDQGGIPRKRNGFPMDCFKCGHHLSVGDGALFKLGGTWEAVCCERVPGPRKKKPGHG